MHFTIDQEDATTVFRLKEERLDSQNASQLKAEFLILAQPDVETLIIDLTEVKYVDSAGLSALLLAERQMTAHEGDVRLVGLGENVQSLLRLTQLDRVFPSFLTVDEALDAEPSFGDEDDDEDVPLAPGAPSASQIKAGAIAAGGSFGAAALHKIMMSPYEENFDELNVLGLGEEDDFDEEEEDDDLDDIDEVDDLDEEDDDDDDEDDDEEEEAAEADAEPAADAIEDDEFEDDDLDDEELEDEDDDDDDL